MLSDGLRKDRKVDFQQKESIDVKSKDINNDKTTSINNSNVLKEEFKTHLEEGKRNYVK